MNLRNLVSAACLFVMTVALPGDASAQPTGLRPLFPSRADIYVESSRLSRLELPAEVLAACRADLSDLRILEADGEQVPYLIDSDSSSQTEVEVRQSFTPELLEVERRTVERSTGPPLQRETYELSAPTEPSQTGTWDLVLSSSRPSFVRRVSITARLKNGAELKMVEGGSVFRLRSLGREKTRLTLPDRAMERLIVTLEGEDGFFLEPAFRFENSRTVSKDRVLVELTETSRQQSDGRTVVELHRPRVLVPFALRIATDTRSLNRKIEVWDEGPGATNAVVGRGTVFRIPAVTTVEELEVRLSSVRGDRLRVVIHDGDSPALEQMKFSAIVRRPALIFALGSLGRAEASGTLYFGGGRAHRPRYDLAELWNSLPNEWDGTRGWSREGSFAPARLGSIGPNPVFDASPILAFAMRPGAEIDTRPYTHQRRLLAKPSPEGLVRLRLGIEDLAWARDDLADLRIVDDQSRQRAYLLDSNAGHESVGLGMEGPESTDGKSRYQLQLPVTPAKIDQVSLLTSVPFFDRAFELVSTRDGDESVLARDRLVRGRGDSGPIRIAFKPARVDSLELIIEDGDDAPLTFQQVLARFPATEVFFAVPEGTYSLLVGNPEATAPTYELARVRDVVLAVESSEAATEPLQSNPDFTPASRLATERGAQQALLWVAIGIAVVFLTALTLRLARREQT